MNYNLFIDKYQPIFLDDFYLKKELFHLLKTLIQTNNLNTYVWITDSQDKEIIKATVLM